MKHNAVLLAGLLVGTWNIGTRKANSAPIPETMARIPAGEFTMGDAFSEGSSNERPAHTVYVSAFYMEKFEVTKALWDEVYNWATTHGYRFDLYGSGKSADYPAFNMDWFDAVKWCNARSEKEGRIPAYYTSVDRATIYKNGWADLRNDWVKWDTGYRLPTEAEWEKAARGGVSGRRFPWGDTIAHSQANYYSRTIYDYDVSLTRGYHPTFHVGIWPFNNPVGYFPPNGYELYDMAGNVLEFCWDFYALYSSDSQNNPRGPLLGPFRVFRGGNLDSRAIGCRTACRYYNGPAVVTGALGFRCVLPDPFPEGVDNFPNLPHAQWVQSPPCEITREDGKNSLIVVTHGWIPPWNTDQDVSWVDNMTNNIQRYLTANELSNWQVVVYKWVEDAYVLWPGDALANGEEKGMKLGECIARDRWSHIHFIAYSAGSALIQAATEAIKDPRMGSADTIIHETFLDAYVGFGYNGEEKYGKLADWSDNYFAHDLITLGEIWQLTEGPLDHTYNVDVTGIDPERYYGATFQGSIFTPGPLCLEVFSFHDWPYKFYTQTIPPNSLTDSEGFGFPLSKEGRGWDDATNQYPVGRGNLQVLDPRGCGETVVEEPPESETFEPNISEWPSLSSLRGLTEVTTYGVALTTPSYIPQELRRTATVSSESRTNTWIVFAVATPVSVNTVSFDTEFLDGNTNGLLTVYWDTNEIGHVDERFARMGSERHSYMFPRAETNETHALGFRLDVFSEEVSSVRVTNIVFGFSGIRDPFSLLATGTFTNGLPVMWLTGPVGYKYTVESSSNLVDWTASAVLHNTNGVVEFVDPSSTNAQQRFYRAVGY
ncbi:MAG: hypothetical protein A3G59_03775 [Candidatus Taylorbacteria bacterium RIFCSPLOWO2_12_FULL_47_20]|uniref:Sulfatase-modifying factor enzyme-like domain-containing protein n=2 Tax=Candidatus Tayloriibacteriota TaxID=1817919 RepID=A0A1G2P8I9_9BACT|nr:MAG: hypothetical protein A3H68_01835 [Candidatus Taylorbacteria bacterium RIFCSPLOWO2_02_FULL_46_40]OHA44685.1 MAG: hypothetical protein A3G59_03775 [Candidatus Taylorbacteria bacterium RIFCSPLOWO2_12_FULL_47_20]